MNIPIPSKAEIEQYLTELKQNGVTVEARCVKCDSETEATILPEESTKSAVCRSCTVKIAYDLE